VCGAGVSRGAPFAFPLDVDEGTGAASGRTCRWGCAPVSHHGNGHGQERSMRGVMAHTPVAPPALLVEPSLSGAEARSLASLGWRAVRMCW
jgi:hypothetical protein